LNLVSRAVLHKPQPADQTWLVELCFLGRYNFEFEIFSFITRIIEKSGNLGKFQEICCEKCIKLFWLIFIANMAFTRKSLRTTALDSRI
jgi:hypothetical protein